MRHFLWRAILLFASFATAYPQPEPCSGWCFKDLRDPNVVYRNGTYYRFTTHGNFTISTAPSISGPWEKKGSCLSNGTMIRLPMHKPETLGDKPREYKTPALWAPDVLLINDTYLMTYSVTRGGRPNEIGMATSRTLEPGSWTDYGSIGLPETDGINRIDSNLLLVNESLVVLAYGSYARGLFMVHTSLPPVLRGSEPQQIAHNSSNVAMEAAFQFSWTVEGKQWYYLFFSSGRCCNRPSHLPPTGDEYKVMVCRSEVATGPFVDDLDKPCLDSGGKMVLGSHGDVYGPGGQGILYDEQLQAPIMYYHYMNKTTGYKVEDVYFGWNKLSFDSGWPVVLGEEDTSSSTEPEDKPNPKHSASARVQVTTTTVTLYVSVLVIASVAVLR